MIICLHRPLFSLSLFLLRHRTGTQLLCTRTGTMAPATASVKLQPAPNAKQAKACPREFGLVMQASVQGRRAGALGAPLATGAAITSPHSDGSGCVPATPAPSPTPAPLFCLQRSKAECLPLSPAACPTKLTQSST